MSSITKTPRVFYRTTVRTERHPVLSLIGVCVGFPLLVLTGLLLAVALLSAPAVLLGWL